MNSNEVWARSSEKKLFDLVFGIFEWFWETMGIPVLATSSLTFQILFLLLKNTGLRYYGAMDVISCSKSTIFNSEYAIFDPKKSHFYLVINHFRLNFWPNQPAWLKMTNFEDKLGKITLRFSLGHFSSNFSFWRVSEEIYSVSFSTPVLSISCFKTKLWSFWSFLTVSPSLSDDLWLWDHPLLTEWEKKARKRKWRSAGHERA